jgi:O-antigen/teichoic acid export membrane protein
MVFGKEFAPALPGCLAIGASTILLIQRRVLSTAGLAFGMPRHCAIAEASRAVVTLAVVASHPTMGGAIAGWCAGEIVGLVLIAVALKKRLGLTYRQVLGINRAATVDLLQYAFRRQHDL